MASPNDTLNFPRRAEMKRLKSFAVNVASVITEGQVSRVAAFPAPQTQFGGVYQSKGAARRHFCIFGVGLMFQQASEAMKTKQRRLNVSVLTSGFADHSPLPSISLPSSVAFPTLPLLRSTD